MDINYTENTLKTSLIIRLYHSGVTDSYAKNLVSALELLNISPQRISWHLR
jgi:hypothetical protein